MNRSIERWMPGTSMPVHTLIQLHINTFGEKSILTQEWWYMSARCTVFALLLLTITRSSVRSSRLSSACCYCTGTAQQLVACLLLSRCHWTSRLLWFECPWRQSVMKRKLGVSPRRKNTVWQSLSERGAEENIWTLEIKSHRRVELVAWLEVL